MVRGFYAAAAGVFSQQKSFNVISNNIANATTPGYKSQGTVEGSFGEHLVSRMSAMSGNTEKNIGPGAFITTNIDQYTDFAQGTLENTGRAVDMAIQGEGFFLIRSDTYGEVATRNGGFELDQEGNLTLPGVGKVLNQGKNPIKLDGSNFTVDQQGIIREDGKETDTLFVAANRDPSELTRVGNDVYESQVGYRRADTKTFKIIQGGIEKSNINMAQEMSKIISGQSHYQSCTQILKIYDGINEISVNQIGRVG